MGYNKHEAQGIATYGIDMLQYDKRHSDGHRSKTADDRRSKSRMKWPRLVVILRDFKRSVKGSAVRSSNNSI